jgi:hypothetical protein
MTSRTAPANVTELPGNYIPSALWNTQITNGTNSFLYNPPYFKGISSTSQSVASGTSWNAITLTTALSDTESGWSSSSPTIYTAQSPGRYLIIGTIWWPAFSTTTLACGVGLSINGTTTRVWESPNAATTGVQIQVSLFTYLGVGSTVGLLGMQNSGSSQSTGTSTVQQPCLEIMWQGAN